MFTFLEVIGFLYREILYPTYFQEGTRLISIGPWLQVVELPSAFCHRGKFIFPLDKGNMLTQMAAPITK